MYETVDALFTGICDAVREKEGTTALINHQDIPERILGISSGGTEKHYIYKSGKEMNGHTMTIHGTSNSEKTEGWIYIHYFYRQAISSDLINADGYKRIGMTTLSDGTKITHQTKYTKVLLRDTSEVYRSGNDYLPAEDGITFSTGNIILYPETATQMSGMVYFDIPEGVNEFYIVFDNVNVDFYLEEMWLE